MGGSCSAVLASTCKQLAVMLLAVLVLFNRPDVGAEQLPMGPGTATRPGDMFTLGKLKLPHPPPRPGCFRLRNGEWTSVPCMPPDKAKRVLPRELYYLEAEPDVLGPPAQLNWASASVTLSRFGGESDTKYGANSWSLQLNTNLFTGADGHQYVVQFILIALPGLPLTSIVEEVDVGKQNYVFDSVSSEPGTSTVLATGDQLLVGGGVHPSQTGMLEMLVVVVPAVGGATQAWATVAPDRHGLAQHWNSVEGDLLGAGSGSKAIFQNSCTVTQLTARSIRNAVVTVLATGAATKERSNLLSANLPQAACPGDGSCSTTLEAQTSGAACFPPLPALPLPARCTRAVTACDGEVSFSCQGEDVGVLFNGNCHDPSGEPVTCRAGFSGAALVTVSNDVHWLGSTTATNVLTVCTEAQGQSSCKAVPAPRQRGCPVSSPAPPVEQCSEGQIWCARDRRCVPKQDCLVSPAKP